MPEAKEYSAMTKDRLMTYTFIALLILAVVAVILWLPITSTSGWSLGLTVAITSFIAVGVAVGVDALLYKFTADSPLNIMSAAVFGLIVALSYTLGAPAMTTFGESILPLEAPDAFIWVGLISLVGLVLFKKIQGLIGRKLVNPAATAKLLVLLPFLFTVLLPADHALNIPTLATSLNYDGFSSFGAWLQFCFGNPGPIAAGEIPALTQSAVFETLFLNKFHGWVGGASSLAVIIVGIALFVLCRRYIKWRITLSYIVTTVVFASLLSLAYGGDPLLRLMFHLFVGSSIFMAFFMATDPATTPLTYMGQMIFGCGLAVITILLQTYANFFGGSILALIIMNLASPKLDRIGRLKPIEGGKEPTLPKAKLFTKIKTTACLRCGACLRVCCNKLSPILIKQAWDKGNATELMTLDADFCAGCGNCNFVCPARIDLKSNMLNFPLSKEEETTIERYFLEGNADEDIGVYTDMFSAKSGYEGQDGGVATALLVSAMKKGLIDAAVVVRRKEGYKAGSIAAENVDDIIEARSTKYMRVRVLSKLGELIAKGKRKIAIVGMPCVVRAARRIQRSLPEDCPDLELIIIGLFCFEDFDYNKLKEETQRLLQIDLDKAEKTQIRKGKFIVTIDGKEHSVAVKELNNAVEKGCLSCPDFAAKYADVSVGSVGSEDGYSTVIVRSGTGKKLLQDLDLKKAEVKSEEIKKLAVRKKKRALQNS